MVDQLNNELIQKIIHAPSLWDKDYPKFEKTFIIPSGMINNKKFDEEVGDIAHSTTVHNKYKKELLRQKKEESLNISNWILSLVVKELGYIH